MIAWTDYPLYPEEANKEAPIREVVVISYDGDKYAVIQFESEKIQIKAGYLYTGYGRISEVPQVSMEELNKLPMTNYDSDRFVSR